MTLVGTVESVWRYPVKSMRGEAPEAIFVGFSGVYGDRIYAIRSSVADPGFPYLTGREFRELVLHQPRFRNGAVAASPPNLTEADGIDPGITSLYAEIDDLGVDVETPDGQVLAIDDPDLIAHLNGHAGEGGEVSLIRSHRSMTDCRPVSLISLQTVGLLAEECGPQVDKRQFRANIYLDLAGAGGFAEDDFVGRTVAIGDKVQVTILERDPRCAMITLDPETAQANPLALRYVAKERDGKAGVYGAVLVEGMVRAGDDVRVVG